MGVLHFLLCCCFVFLLLARWAKWTELKQEMTPTQQSYPPSLPPYPFPFADRLEKHSHALFTPSVILSVLPPSFLEVARFPKHRNCELGLAFDQNSSPQSLADRLGFPISAIRKQKLTAVFHSGESGSES